MKKKTRNPAVDELLKMKLTTLALNAVALLVCVLYVIFSEFRWQLFSGLALGNLLFIGNFLLIGLGAKKTVSCKSEKSGKNSAFAFYAMRYMGLFLIIGFGAYFGLVDILTAFAPLFIPRIHYTFEYIFSKKKKVKGE